MKELKCSLCHRKISPSIGKACEMCGMLLYDASREFCSKQCKAKYSKLIK